MDDVVFRLCQLALVKMLRRAFTFLLNPKLHQIEKEGFDHAARVRLTNETATNDLSLKGRDGSPFQEEPRIRRGELKRRDVPDYRGPVSCVLV